MQHAHREPATDLTAFVEQESSPAWRTLLLTISLLLAAFFSWIGWAEVDEVVLARGEVEPAGRVKIVNHPQGGRVAAIEVREGDRVSAGDLLIRLDPAIEENQRQEVRARYHHGIVEVARLEAELAKSGLKVPSDLRHDRPDLVAGQDRMLEANLEAFKSQNRTLSDVLAAKQGEVQAARAQSTKLTSSLELLVQQVDAVRDLTERGFYPRLKLVELERELNETRGELEQARAGETAAASALAEARSRLAEHETNRRSQLLAELEAAKASRDGIWHELQSQETRVDNLLVRAPADGIIQELAVTSIGQAVAPQEKLMKLVPMGEGLIIRAAIENDDIGLIRTDMPATVKVLAYDFMRHGTLAGKVAGVAADSHATTDGEDLIYDVKVVTEKDYLGTNPGERAVLPGMIVNVELKVADRTILSYFTDRIIKLRDETFREG